MREQVLLVLQVEMSSIVPPSVGTALAVSLVLSTVGGAAGTWTARGEVHVAAPSAFMMHATSFYAFLVLWTQATLFAGFLLYQELDAEIESHGGDTPIWMIVISAVCILCTFAAPLVLRLARMDWRLCSPFGDRLLLRGDGAHPKGIEYAVATAYLALPGIALGVLTSDSEWLEGVANRSFSACPVPPAAVWPLVTESARACSYYSG